MLDNLHQSSLRRANALGEQLRKGCKCFVQSLRQGLASFKEVASLDDENKGKDELEELIRRMLSSGQIDTDALAKFAGVMNPALMSQLFSQAQSLFAQQDGPVNWDMAQKQAADIAKKDQAPVDSGFDQELHNAFSMARLWLSEVTEFSTSSEVKLLTRSMWVADAMPLFTELSEPVALSTAKALAESLGELLPEELSQMLGPATQFVSNAGAAIFAMQLGQAVGKLASKTLSSTEIGIPISPRPGLVSQNVREFIRELETPKSEVVIFLAIRELAISSLYASNRWLRDQIATQVREFAAGLKVEISGIEELMQQADPSDSDSMERIMEATAMMSHRTDEQEAALVRIETLLALIDGWADAVTEAAAKRLSNVGSLAELVGRKRITEGASEKTFEILLGLQLQPKLRREAKSMWQQLEQLGPAARDALWQHPDQLPSIEEIADPMLLMARLNQDPDDFDGELRKLLGN